MIAEVARSERVGLFSRFALMRRAIEAGLPADALVSWDRLHNSAAGYECIGRALARATPVDRPSRKSLALRSEARAWSGWGAAHFRTRENPAFADARLAKAVSVEPT